MSRRPVPSRSLAALTVAVAGVLLLPATPGVAQEPLELRDQVTDDAGLLIGRETEVDDALAEVRDDVQLFVATTDTTGPESVTDFADEVAASNSLGGNDALLLIAIEDRSYALWAADDLVTVTDAELTAISRDVIEPRLADGDVADAAIAAAGALADAAATDEGDGAEPAPSGAAQPGDGGLAPWFLPLMLLLPVAVFGGLALMAALRERRGRRRTAEERDRRIGDLARRTNARLIASDEAVREATTELGFAEAQFHPEDVAPFASALAAAREELHAAFAIRQRLDDGTPESIEQRQAMLERIDARIDRIDELLAAEHARLDELRDRERRAPSLLADLRHRIEAMARRCDGVRSDHERVLDASATARAAIGGNLVEADKHLLGAAAAVDGGLRAVEDDDRSVAARALRDAEFALAASERLISSVEHAAAELDEAKDEVDTTMASAESALDRADEALADAPRSGREAVHAGRPAPPPPTAPGTTADRLPPPPAPAPAPRTLHQVLVDGRQQLARARTRRTDDVIVAYQLAAGAQAAADEVLGRIQEAHDRRELALGAALAGIRTAEAAYRRAEDFIETRRRGIGREARTRLQESERHLERARGVADDVPDEAIRHASSAQRLAAEAYRLAQEDFQGYDDQRGPFGRAPYGGRGGGTVVIGGFPVPLGGTRRSGGGFGGTVWGSPGPPGRSRGPTIGGRFGGGGRSVGGGFGGGRSRGGRF